MFKACVLAVIGTGFLLVSGANASTILGSVTWDVGGHTYYLVEFDPESPQDWSAALADVPATLGSDFRLAAITSADEDSVVRALLAQRGWEWWIGAYQEPITETDPRAGWTWVTGEPFRYTNWCSGEPNDAEIGGREQHLALDFGGACWNDEGSAISMVRGYVAESYDGASVPEPATLTLFGLGIFALGGARRFPRWVRYPSRSAT